MAEAKSQAIVPTAGPALTAVPVVGVIVGLLARWLVPGDPMFDIGVAGWVVALMIGFAGAELGAWNARLLVVIRHTYNLHYVALLTLALFSWTLAFGPVMGGPVWLGGFLQGLMVGSAAAAAACVAGSMFARPGKQRGAAFLAAAFVFCLAGARGMGWPVIPLMLFLPGAILWQRADKAIPKLSNGQLGAIGAVSFIAISVLALLGMGQLLAMIVMPIFQGFDGPQPPPPPLNAILQLEIARVVLSAGAAMVVCGASFAWPHRRPNAVLLGTAIVSALLAALNVGHALQWESLPAAVAMLAGLIGATAVTAVLPRRRRWAGALVVAGAGALVGIEFFRELLSEHPMALACQWFAEALLLIGLWMIVYLLGVRKMRVWAEERAPS